MASSDADRVRFSPPSGEWGGPIPVADLDSQGYWNNIRDHKLTIQRCVACRKWVHPPLAACDHCQTFNLQFEPVSGHGTVYSYTIVNREFTPGILPPYVVVLVDLDDADARLLSNIVNVAGEDLHIGMKVEVIFHDITPTAALALFQPRGNG